MATVTRRSRTTPWLDLPTTSPGSASSSPCNEPVVIGHSLGGAIALEMCGRHPELASGLIMINSIVMGRRELRESLEVSLLLQGIGGPDYLAVSRANAWEIGCDYDDPARRQAIFDEYILPPCESTPQHVAFSALRNVLDHEPTAAAEACRIPMAYISADVPLVNMARDLDRLQGALSAARHRQDDAGGPFQHHRGRRPGQCDDRALPGRGHATASRLTRSQAG